LFQVFIAIALLAADGLTSPERASGSTLLKPSPFESEEQSPFVHSWNDGVRLRYAGQVTAVPEIDSLPIHASHFRSPRQDQGNPISAANATANCSAFGKEGGGQDRQGCSATDKLQKCSVHNNNIGFCSTEVGRGNSDAVPGCSAVKDGNRGDNPKQCSIFAGSDSKQCSARAEFHSNCSAGRQSSDTASCSIYAAEGSKDNTCSAFGSSPSSQEGQYNNCSVGSTNNKDDDLKCSVFGSAKTEGHPNRCSVFGQGGSDKGDQRPTKCSMFSISGEAKANCSVFDSSSTDSSNTGHQCSAYERMRTGGMRTDVSQCSVHDWPGVNPLENTQSCSVLGAGANVKGQCSAFEDVKESQCSVFTKVSVDKGAHFCSVESGTQAVCTAMGATRDGTCSVATPANNLHCSVKGRGPGGFEEPTNKQCKGTP
jgi:hypothetical protein